MSARPGLVVIGLDGADLRVVEGLGPTRLPNLSRLAARGTSAALQSTLPFATLPAWTSILTGAPPAEHGVFDFTERDGYRVRFAGARARRLPTTFARLDEAGRRVALLGFPATYPPERFARGVAISGWDSPVAFEADRSFVHPPALWDELVRRFGPLRFDDVDEFDGGPGWHDALAGRLAQRLRARCDLYLHLLAQGPWDVFACYFGETDTAGHHLWALSDPASPRRPVGAPVGDPSPLAQVYCAADEAVGALVAAAGPGANVLVVSDHGMGGTSDEVVYLNRMLEAAGLLVTRGPHYGSRIAQGAKNVALRSLPPRARERLFRALGARLPSWLESRVRFGGIDFSRTLAFSEELPYAPSVWLNLAGREPLGLVREQDRDRVLARVVDALGPVIAASHRREAVHLGPAAHRAPDLLLELAAPGGYTLNLAPSSAAPPGVVRRRLRADERLGRKGAPMSGAHRHHGILLGDGPDLAGRGRVEMDVVEAGRLIGALAGLEGGEARVLRTAPGALTAGEEAILAARLRSLGYMD